jgi:Fanconi anemia group M protein
VDEAHRSVGNYAYVYIAKKYMAQASDPLILALTASPGATKEKINEIRQQLFIQNIEIRTREDNDVKPYIQEVSKEWVEVELQPELKEIRKFIEKAKEEKIRKLMSWGILRSPMVNKTQIVRLQQELARRRTGPSWRALSYLAELMKIDHASLLLETQCLYSLQKYFEKMQTDANEKKTQAVARLMKDENFLNAIKLTDKAIADGLEHPKIAALKELVEKELQNEEARIIVFAQIRDTITKIHDTLKNIQGCGPVEFIGQAKKKGKGLSQKEQIQIVNEFKMGFYNVLIATSIAEEGLDITETNAVIFYEPVPSAIRRIQRSGRTARTQSGKVIILMTKNTRDEAYYWVGHHKERKMTKILHDMQNKLSSERQKGLSDFRKI